MPVQDNPIPVTRRRRQLAVLASTVTGFAIVVAAVGLAAPQDRPTRETASCTTAGCHTDIISRPRPHAPAARHQCVKCHASVDPAAHEFQLALPMGELCASCHTMTSHDVVHAPFATNDCGVCHDPHGSEHEMLLVADPGTTLCSQCHDDYEHLPFVHGPVAVGACLACHDAHSSRRPALLTDDADRLCLDCHTEVVPTGAASRHRHGALDSGCGTCHDPHASEFRYQLHTAESTMCFSCHPDVQRMIEESPVVHAQPGRVECTGCHAPHASALPKLQRRRQPEQCLRCHSEAVKTQDGRLLTNMALLLEQNPNHHGPIRDGGCTGCHRPHAAERHQLLIQDYPPEFYAAFDTERYQLCFTCHLADLVLDESGTGLTGFRDGDRNLHWLHVNQEKGRTCRACHEVHASGRPFHMRDAVPFGSKGWMLKINFETTPDGGTCAPACHKPKKYSRTRDAVELGIGRRDAPVVDPTTGDAR